MGCGCGGRSRKAGAVGIAPANPMIFGTDDNNLPVIRAMLLQASGSVPAGSTRFVRGTGVDQAAADGIIRVL
jgi:hypothetical protein